MALMPIFIDQAQHNEVIVDVVTSWITLQSEYEKNKELNLEKMVDNYKLTPIITKMP